MNEDFQESELEVDDFDPSIKIEDTKWIVENFIPTSHLCFVLAQAGVGKSLLVESIATAIVCGVPYGGLKTVEGDVLIIDQDTPTNTLNRRLSRLISGLGVPKKHHLWIKSMQGYTLSERTINTIIADYPTAVLTIIDSLHSVCGKLNPNLTSDMNILSRLKQERINSHNSILINHHITQKLEDPSVNNLMTGDTASLAMGSSVIIQQADSYYIVGATAKDGITERIYVRSVSKRVSIPGKPIILRVIPTGKEKQGETVEYDGRFDAGVVGAEQDIMILFREQNIDRTVKEVYEAMGHKHGENAIRDALETLDQRGLLIMSRHKSNLFKFRLP